jgi:hypothetical protein
MKKFASQPLRAPAAPTVAAMLAACGSALAETPKLAVR